MVAIVISFFFLVNKCPSCVCSWEKINVVRHNRWQQRDEFVALINALTFSSRSAFGAGAQMCFHCHVSPQAGKRDFTLHYIYTYIVVAKMIRTLAYLRGFSCFYCTGNYNKTNEISMNMCVNIITTIYILTSSHITLQPKTGCPLKLSRVELVSTWMGDLLRKLVCCWQRC